MNYVTACEQMAVKQAEQETKPEAKPWPHGGDKCFFVYGYGEVTRATFWEGDIIDSLYHEMGNAYRTREEAERAVARQKAGVRVLNAIKKWNEENDDITPHELFKSPHKILDAMITYDIASVTKEELLNSYPSQAFLDSIKADWLLWKGWDL